MSTDSFVTAIICKFLYCMVLIISVALVRISFEYLSFHTLFRNIVDDGIMLKFLISLNDLLSNSFDNCLIFFRIDSFVFTSECAAWLYAFLQGLLGVSVPDSLFFKSIYASFIFTIWLMLVVDSRPDFDSKIHSLSSLV